MLKISVIQINNEGNDFSGIATPQMLNLDVLDDIFKDVAFEQPVEYHLHVSLVSGGILVVGSLSTAVKCNCGRCLEEFDFQLQNVEVCHYHENFTDNELDLAPELREDLLISLPMKYICRTDCPGIEYEISTSETEKEAGTELDSGNNPWKDLEGLNLDS